MAETTIFVPDPTGGVERGACAHCAATVLWARTEAHGRPMCLDVDPNPAGLCFLVDNAEATGWVVRVIGYRKPVPDELAALPRYVAHRATCPAGSPDQRRLRPPAQRRRHW